MRVPEAVRVDLAERSRVAIGGKLVRHRDGVIAQALRSAGDSWTARIETEYRCHDRVEPLRLAGGVRIRSAAVAEPVIAAAGVEQAVVGIARLRRRVELDRSHRVGQVLDDVSFAEEFSPSAVEDVRRGVRGVTFGDDVVI